MGRKLMRSEIFGAMRHMPNRVGDRPLCKNNPGGSGETRQPPREPKKVDLVPEVIEPIQKELHRILRSHTFSRAARLRDLLEHIVTCWMDGQANKLDGYNLAIEVFGREESFESAIDPIVRVQMARLRNQLSHYYSIEGLADSIRVDIPKGAYIPVVRTQIPATAEDDGFQACSLKTVMMLPLVSHVTLANPDTSDALTISDHLLYLLTCTTSLRVTSRVSSATLDRTMDARRLGQYCGAQFIIEGSLSRILHASNITIYLVETEQGFNVWSGRYPILSSGLISTTELLYKELLCQIRKYSDSRDVPISKSPVLQ